MLQKRDAVTNRRRYGYDGCEHAARMRHIIDRVLELQEDTSEAQQTPSPEEQDLVDLLKTLQPRIRVFGCGGCGNNTVSRLSDEGLLDDEYVVGWAINTDAQHLLKINAEHKMLIGRTASGRGAGGDPEMGEKAALESERNLTESVNDCDLAFVTAGLGGGTGTGSAHVIARLAKAAGALTIGVVTYPFASEGTQRRQNADWGLQRLREVCDTVVVLPNDRLLEVEGVRDLPIGAAFRVADELLMRSIAGVTELISKEGLVNLDFEDLRSVMVNGGGTAMIGYGEGRGPDRSEFATRQALESPLLDIDVSDARGALVNVVAGKNLTLGEAEMCAQIIRESISPHARIIWGATVDESMEEELRVLIVLTGVRSEQIHGTSLQNRSEGIRSRSATFIT